MAQDNELARGHGVQPPPQVLAHRAGTTFIMCLLRAWLDRVSDSSWLFPRPPSPLQLRRKHILRWRKHMLGYWNHLS
jgi:hypothetical protein